MRALPLPTHGFLAAAVACVATVAPVACVPAAAAAERAEPWRGVARHLIVLVIDGPRWTETWGHSDRRYIPVRNALLPQATWYANFQNDGWTYTNCGHAAMTTGYYEQIENSGNQLPGHPSWFQFWREATGATAERAWVISAKDKLHVLAKTTDATWAGRAPPTIDCGNDGNGGGGYRDDLPTQRRVLDTIAAHKPALLLVNYRGPDSCGHGADWNGYTKAIRETDHLVGEVWASVQADPVMKDRTDLFITNDHGRHTPGVQDDFVNHGCPCDGCRHIELLAMGPDIAKGRSLTLRRDQTDLAATIAWLAGVTLPGSPGEILTELFSERWSAVELVADPAAIMPADVVRTLDLPAAATARRLDDCLGGTPLRLVLKPTTNLSEGPKDPATVRARLDIALDSGPVVATHRVIPWAEGWIERAGLPPLAVGFHLTGIEVGGRWFE